MKVLFVGAGGSGMAGLVGWHEKLGNVVYVQDDSVSTAELLQKYPGARPFEANAKIIFDRAVFSDAIPVGHPLRDHAASADTSVRSYAEELGALSDGRHVIAIAGTHGKSTTTALISWALTVAERDPLCVIGAEIGKWHGGFRYGNGPVIVEADEYKKHFLHLRPTAILVTSLEADHFDTYANEGELVQTFADFCSRESAKSVFIARGTRALDRLSEELERRGRSHVRFGNENDPVFCARFDILGERSHAIISIEKENQDFEFRTAGCPHISNLLGVVAVLAHEDVPITLLKKGIDSFPGILRRLELLGKIGSVSLYSDYAHHPTAVRETLRILSKIFPNHHVGVIFEPHERLRTSTLRDEYKTAFADADAIGILPVYDPIGRQRPDISNEATTIFAPGDVVQLGNYAAAFSWAQQFAEKYADNGILVTMGAGPIDGAFRKFIANGS